MSAPFGPSADVIKVSGAAQMRSFQKTVEAYAKARVEQDRIGRQIAEAGGPATAELRQRLADAGHDLFQCGEALKAYAMVLAGDDVLSRSAELLEADQAPAI